MNADFEYLTETWTSSWGGSLGSGSLEKFLNDQRRLGFELVSVCQIMEGHDMRGEVGTVWKVPAGTIAQRNEEGRRRHGDDYHD